MGHKEVVREEREEAEELLRLEAEPAERLARAQQPQADRLAARPAEAREKKRSQVSARYFFSAR